MFTWVYVLAIGGGSLEAALFRH